MCCPLGAPDCEYCPDRCTQLPADRPIDLSRYAVRGNSKFGIAEDPGRVNGRRQCATADKVCVGGADDER